MIMHVAMVTSAKFPPEEGMGYYVWNLSEYLVARGHHVDIVTRGGPRMLAKEEKGNLTIWRPFFVRAYPVHVHIHGFFVNALVRRLEGSVDLFHVHSPLPPPIRTKRPVLLTVHSPMKTASRNLPLDSVRAVKMKMETPVSVSIEKELIRKAGLVCTVSKQVAQHLGEYGIDAKTVAVMGNGVDTEEFSPSPDVQSDTPLVLYVGRLDVGKGLGDLVEAAPGVISRFGEVKFLLAGGGPLASTLSTMVAERGLEGHFSFPGHIKSRAALIELYRRATVFVLPSHYEGLPTVLLEAMACGRAVVATAVGGALDVINDGVNGILVPPRDPRALAAAILELLQNRSLAERLGSTARRTVQERFSWPIVASGYMRIYRQVLRDFAA